MINETLKNYLNQFISVRTINSPNLLVGTLKQVESDYIVLQGDFGSEVIISTKHIVSVLRK